MADIEKAIDQMADEWQRCGVKAGDLFLLHSSARRTCQTFRKLGTQIEPRHIIESFIRLLGPEGTLVLPVFNYDFNRGIPFDVRSTPSQVGAISEAGRLFRGAIRSGHPVYSVAAIGRKAELFRTTNISGYGQDSPFSVIHKEDGRIGVLDVTELESMTFYHYVEESEQIPYRYFKQFTGIYVDEQARISEREFTLFVRYMKDSFFVIPDMNPMGELLWNGGLYTGDRPFDGAGLRTVKARSAFDLTSTIIRLGKAEGHLYRLREGSATVAPPLTEADTHFHWRSSLVNH